LSLYQPKEAVGNDSLFRTTGSGTQRAHLELRIDNPNKGETMDTLLIVIVVMLLLGGGGWGYSRWRR
jgi:LPXTG-motif cell wall-anchored protein